MFNNKQVYVTEIKTVQWQSKSAMQRYKWIQRKWTADYAVAQLDASWMSS